jgi:DNA invertase Pin-like site-specific DNA recombinase
MARFVPRKVVKGPVALRAVEYLRASTDHQRFSISNQQRAIAKYAADNNIAIVRSYLDPARTGVTMRNRRGLKQLISDVHDPHRNFNTILVFDVSRWGRFQDIDESAHYEFLCKARGVSIRYCVEPFVNDGALVNTIMKSMKRAMAGEYSRDLSARVSQAQLRLAAMGFHQGGTPNFGLRRILIDEQGQKRELKNGERKCLVTDKVVLVPGPKNETDVVRDVFRLFVTERLPKARIATTLNRRGFQNSRGYPWTGHTIDLLLRCERYLGTLIYNRTSLKLGSERIENPREQWIRIEKAFPPIVDPKLFRAAQLILNDTWALSDNDMLDYLTSALCIHGFLSAKILDRSPILPTTNTYCEHFGSLANAYRLIGYKPAHKYRYRGLSDTLRRLDQQITAALISAVERSGGHISLDFDTHLLTIDDESTVAVVLVPHVKKVSQIDGWRLYLTQVKPCDVILMARLNHENRKVLDYHLFPRSIFLKPTFGFTDTNISSFASYKLPMLDEFYAAFIQKVQSIEYLLSRSDSVGSTKGFNYRI